MAVNLEFSGCLPLLEGRGHSDAYGVVRHPDALLILFYSFKQAQAAIGFQRELSRYTPDDNTWDQPVTN
jgi:hypothetical protein